MTHVNRLAPELTFKTKVWMPFAEDARKQQFLDPEEGVFPLIHWAGDEFPTMVRERIFLEYRTLGLSPAERAGYLRHFYYRRYRAQLKAAMKKSRWFAGWVERRDEWLRRKHVRAAAPCP
jgi:hypothetical protein